MKTLTSIIRAEIKQEIENEFQEKIKKFENRIQILENEINSTEEVKTNKNAMVELLKVFKYSNMR